MLKTKRRRWQGYSKSSRRNILMGALCVGLVYGVLLINTWMGYGIEAFRKTGIGSTGISAAVESGAWNTASQASKNQNIAGKNSGGAASQTRQDTKVNYSFDPAHQAQRSQTFMLYYTTAIGLLLLVLILLNFYFDLRRRKSSS